jgi:hypothetical protein
MINTAVCSFIRYGGTGLGLVLCNRIITTMGGLMEIESEVGRGSVFTAYVDLEILDVRLTLHSLNSRHALMFVLWWYAVQDSERLRHMDDSITVAAVDSAEIDIVRTPAGLRISSSLGEESGEVDNVRRMEENRLQRERLLQQQQQQRIASGLEGLTSGERAALLGVNRRKVDVGIKLSDWIWERACESHANQASSESGEFTQENEEGQATSCTDVTGSGLQGNIFPLLRFYSSYEEMRRSGRKFILLCLKNDSFRAIVLSYLHAFMEEMRAASVFNVASMSSAPTSAAKASLSGRWDVTPEQPLSSTPSFDEEVSKAKEEHTDEDTMSMSSSGDSCTVPQPPDSWGIIEVEDIYDENFLQLLVHMEEGQKRDTEGGDDGNDAPAGKTKDVEDDASASDDGRPSARATKYRPRFDAVVMDLGFYEHLESEYGTAERKSSPSLQYLRSLIFQGGSGVMARRFGNGGKNRKSSSSSNRKPTVSPSSSRKMNDSATTLPTNTAARKPSPEEARYIPPNNVTVDVYTHLTCPRLRYRKRRIRFEDRLMEPRPFLVLISPLLEKTKVANLFKCEKIDGSLTTPIKKNELKYVLHTFPTLSMI